MAGIATTPPSQPAAIDARPAELKRLSTESVPVWREIWDRRRLLSQFVLRDVRLRYHQAVMGFLWALLMPCLVLGASVVVRSLFARQDAAVGQVSLMDLAIKAWAWAFFVGSITFATTSLLSNMHLISKIYFPREVLPMAAIGAQGVDALTGLVFLGVLSPWLGTHYSLGLFWLVPLLFLLLLLTLGLALLLSAANVFYRDIKYLVQVGVTFGIFVSPVFFSVGDLGPRSRHLVLLNPLSPILEGLRLAVGHGGNLLTIVRAPDGSVIWSPLWLLWSGGVGLLLLIVAVRFFRARADQFAELA